MATSVEMRLKAQRRIWHRLAMSDEREKQAIQPAPFITISRQYGCIAYALADRLAQRLNAEFPEWNFTIYDRKILEMMVENEPIKMDVINSLSERTRGVIEDWIGDLLAERPPEMRVFNHLATTLCSIAALGQAIIIGRGGAAITRKIPMGIHVCIIAPIDWRIENLRNYPDRASKASMEIVKQADKERESFVKKYLGVDVYDPELYHLVMNNQSITMEEQVEIIVKLVQEKNRAMANPGSSDS